MDSLIFSVDDELSHDHNMLGMNCSIGDPIFLSKRVGGVNNKLLGF